MLSLKKPLSGHLWQEDVSACFVTLAHWTSDVVFQFQWERWIL